jgi:uncharacterized membrane protein YcaP (DUF421 family)
MFFDSWQDVARTIIVGVLSYAALVFLLRVSGKRTLSKMNAFDLVVTVALGSTLATIILSKDIALMEGIAAFATLILLQYIVAWLSVRSSSVRKLVKSEPRLLFYQGEFVQKALWEERVTREEVYAAIRSQGIPLLENAEAVILETDGTFSVLQSSPQTPTTLEHVKHESVSL